MNKNLKKIFLLIVVTLTAMVCFAFSANANTVLGRGSCGDNLTWTVYDDLSMKITGTGPMYNYNQTTSRAWDKYGKVKEVTVESGVTRIGSFAFFYNEELKYVSLADTVQEIGMGAFMNSGIKGIDTTDGLKKIDSLAFAYSSIKEIYLPEGLEYIGNSAFSSSELSGISVPSTVKQVEDFCFSITPLTKAEFAEGVEKIGTSVFSQCFYLSNVSLPSTLNSIGDLAFYRCSSLKTLTIPEKVSSIGDNPFSRCTQLELKINSKNTCFKIKNGAVYTSDLKEIICYPYTGTSTTFIVDSATEIINGSCFATNTNLETVVLPENLKVIEYGAFDKCSSLVNIKIPDSVTEIQTQAFSECSKAQLSLPANIKELGYSVFYNCDAFTQTDLYLPDSLKTIGNSAFLDCDSITQLSVGNVESMGENVFSYCDSLETVVFREGIRAIEMEDSSSTPIFENCKSLKNITLPQSLEKIGNKYFSNIPNLEKIVLPKKLTNIGVGAFSGCAQLKEVDFSYGKSLKEIGIRAFAYCSSLTTMDFSSFSELEIKDEAFYECTNLKTVKSGNYSYSLSNTAFEKAGVADGSSTFYMGKTLVRAATDIKGEFLVTDGTTVILNKAFESCVSVEKIGIPASVTSIAADAFSNCSALKEIYYEGSLAQWNKLFKTELQGITINTKYNYIYENEEFTLDSAGIMRILIEGEMKNYHVYVNPLPNPNLAYGNGSSWYLYNGDIKVLQFINKITRIGHFAFDNVYNLSEFSIPSTVKSIGYHAFDRTAFSNQSSNWIGGVLYKDNCALDIRNDSETITIKSGTRIIADNGNPAQVNVIRIPGIKKISLPSSVENVGKAFATGYEDLTDITVSADNKTYADVNGVLFSKDKTQLIKYPEGKSGTVYTVPATVKTLANYSFALSNLEKVYIPASVTQVGYYAFENCYNLKEIYYGGSQAQWEEAIGNLKDSAAYQRIKVSYNYHEHIGNTAVRENLKPSTCVEAGSYDEVVYCKICSQEMTRKNITLKAKGHTWNSGKITTASTCAKEGVKTYTCTVVSCGKTKTEAVAKKKTHTYSNACDKSCNVCSGTRKPLAHKYTNSCDKRCNVCKSTRTISHSYKKVTTKATLSKSGKIQHKCTVCGYIASKSTTIYRPISIKLSTTAYTYNGKVKKPSVTVKDSKGNTLKKDTDYTVKYESGCKLPGKYTVTITFKGKYSGTKKLAFTIAPKVTSKITATQTITTITLKWNKVTGADGYRVYKYNSNTKKYEKFKDVTGTSLKLTKLKAGTTYKFKVRAYTNDDGTIFGKHSSAFATATKTKTPSITGLTSSTKGKAVIKWSNVSGETGYQVYYSTSKNGTYKKLDSYEANKTTGSKSKLTSKKTYYFKVRAYKKTESGTVYSSWSSVKSVKIK